MAPAQRDATTRIVFSAAEDYLRVAERELRDAFGAAVRVERLGSDTGCLVGAEGGIARVAQVCRARPVVFVRHLMRAVTRFPTEAVPGDLAGIGTALRDLAREEGAPAHCALQVWASADPLASRIRPDEIWREIAARLTEAGMSVARGGQGRILSVCVTPRWTLLGSNTAAEALTDWPGGRVGLAKGAGAISRAEFKLEELVKVSGIALPTHGTALDLGASPGGWTRIVRGRGLTVWAVDPARLDPRLAADAGVRHIATTAADFLDTTETEFDLVMNDMRMDPVPSCRVLVAAARHLRPGGLAIMTLKLLRDDPLAQVAGALAILRSAYEIVFVRQLFHNRHEVTVVARRAGREMPDGTTAATTHSP